MTMRKNVQKILLMMCFYCWVMIPFADAQVLVEQGKVKVSLAPAQKTADALTVHNTGNEAIDLTVYFEDFRYIPPFRGKKEFFPSGTVSDSCSQWINFYPQTVHIPPFSQKKINYTINMPADASGGYYCVLFMEKTILDGALEQVGEGSKAGLTVLSRVGTLFFVETNDRAKKIAVSDISIDGGAMRGTVKNQGNVTVVITPLFYILNSDSGVPADRGEADKIYLPAGSDAQFEIKLSSGVAKDGQYLAVLTFDLEDGASSVTEVEFSRTGANYKVTATR